MTFYDDEDGILLVTGFTLGAASFGLEARLVQEVVKVGEVTRVHGAPSDVVGIRNLRGRIVTVIDTAAHLALGNVPMGPETRLLIMEHQGESYGFLVDTVTDAIAIDGNKLGDPPNSLNDDLRGCLLGVWRDDERVTAILDPKSLFRWEDDSDTRRFE